MQTVTYMCELEQVNPLTQVPSEPYILVIDDDPSILSVVSFLLDTEEYPNIALPESSSVLPFLQEVSALGKRLPSLILLDLMMPILSGYDMAAALSQHPQLSHIPILIMTADHRVKTVSCVPGATDVINKPFHIDVLLSKIEQFLAP